MRFRKICATESFLMKLCSQNGTPSLLWQGMSGFAGLLQLSGKKRGSCILTDSTKIYLTVSADLAAGPDVNTENNKNMSNKEINIIASKGDVVIRELMDSDLPKLAEYGNNPKVAINLRDSFPHPYSFEDAVKFKEMVDSMNPKVIFAIEYKGEYAGNICLIPCSDVYRKSAEIGYFLGEPFWNKGIMTQAVNLISKWGFENLGVVRIHTGVFEFNKASQRVLEKCGFVLEGTFLKAVIKNNQLYNEIRFAKISD